MDIIIDQVMQLEVVHITDGNAVVELVAGTAVINGGLTVAVQLDLGEVDDMALLTHDLGPVSYTHLSCSVDVKNPLPFQTEDLRTQKEPSHSPEWEGSS